MNEADILSSAPNLTIGSNRVRLDGMRYRITLDLPQDDARVVSGFPVRRSAEREGGSRTVVDWRRRIIEATPGRALPPLTIRGAGGWLSGYVVPVMSGRLAAR